MEFVFLPQKVADRRHKYISDKCFEAGDRVFPISYAAVRIIAKKAGGLSVLLGARSVETRFVDYAYRIGA